MSGSGKVRGRSEQVERLRRMNALLADALELPEASRAGWLHALAQQDAAAARDIAPLLERTRDATDLFMAGKAVLRLPEALNETPAASDKAGDCIGPYRLLRELGRGGMGTVWLAERFDGALQRQVALKLPLHGWSLAVRERLVQERDNLAALEHPHIARLYDAGTTQEGRPYLAMEVVDGKPIDLYAQEQGATVEQRLQLFLQVARAVAYAHGRLIVHRDLKPSNILVTRNDGVRLLDFGAAKLLGSDGAINTGLTQWAGRAFSPDYASPEQILGRPVNVASDVYSAGVVLYELLTGRRPYRLRRDSAAALEEAILAADVPLASSVAGDPRVARQLRGDLDAILARALQRRPEDRYASMEAFAEDISRHLCDEPVHAKPPSRRYRLAKFVRRNVVGVLAVSAVALALLIGGGVAAWQGHSAGIEARRATEAHEFIASIFTEAVPRTGKGGVVRAVDLLDSATRRLETELADEPAVAAQLGLILAQSYSALGEPVKAELPLVAAIPRAEQALGREHPLTLRLKIERAIAIGLKDPKGSESLLAEVIPVALRSLPAAALDAADALEQRSFVLAKQDRAEESYAALLQATALREKYLGRLHQDTIYGIGLLANTYGRFGDRQRQMATAEDALRRAHEALGSRRPHAILLAIERWYAEALRANQRPRESVPILRRVLRDQLQLDASPTVRVRNAQLQLARSLLAVGWVDQGLPLVRTAVALEREQNPEDTEDRRAYADTLVAALVAARRSEEAVKESARSRAITQRLSAPRSQVIVQQTLQWAAAQALQGQWDASRSTAAEVSRLAAGEWPEAAAQASVVASFTYRQQRRPAEALGVTRALVASPQFEQLPFAVRAAIQAEVANASLDAGDVAAGALAADACYRLFHRAQVENSVQSAECVIANARVAIARHRPAHAEDLLLPLLRQWAVVGADRQWIEETQRWLHRAGSPTA
jgi:hypothetical protein